MCYLIPMHCRLSKASFKKLKTKPWNYVPGKMLPIYANDSTLLIPVQIHYRLYF